MKNVYIVLGIASLIVMLWYEKKRWEELGRPARSPFGWNASIRHLWLYALWPWPVWILAAIWYYQGKGDGARVAGLKRRFDGLSGLSGRISAATHWSLAELETPAGSAISQGPGWWLASDGKWYPPELQARPRDDA